jgi:hypothetical protein
MGYHTAKYIQYGEICDNTANTQCMVFPSSSPKIQEIQVVFFQRNVALHSSAFPQSIIYTIHEM